MRGQMTHPDTDALAEFRAGLITGRRGTQMAGHLAGCERCTALSGQLAEISVLLATVPAPAMPATVGRRLDTVLAAEVAKRDDPERARGDSLPELRTPGRRPGQHRFRLVTLRVLVPAAAVVILAAGGYGLSRLGLGSPTYSTSAGSAASAGPRHTSARAAAPAPVDNPNLSPERVPPLTFLVVISPTDYQHATLRQQLTSELRGQPAASRPASVRIRDCVRRVTGGTRPVLVESARYQGQPATIIVVSRSSGDIAWVAGARCSASSSDLLDTPTTLPPGISAP